MKVKIAHLADLHIRGLSRHDEIRTVIQAFCDDANLRSIDHIVIVGDIFHTKTSGITAEYIDLMSWVFLSMANVCKHVHVTLGNHDGALTNLTRQDAISPIVKALNNPRIKIYKDSGVYQVDDGSFNLCVYSVFDSDNWDKVKPVAGEYNVAVFHGSVAGAETEIGWALEADISVKYFDELGYDLVLLGDIHRRQFLGYREYEE